MPGGGLIAGENVEVVIEVMIKFEYRDQASLWLLFLENESRFGSIQAEH